MDFKIITVNGTDLSGASHEEASRAFESAQEPITVVLKRNNPSASEPPRIPTSKPIQSYTTRECFCQYLLENCTDISHPLSSLIMSEYLRFQRTRNHDLNEACNGEIFPSGNELIQITPQEVVLVRSSESEKLGITLYDEIDPQTNQNRVLVTQVSPKTVAARSRNIFEGDHILKIDGKPVTCTKSACQMLKSGSNSVTFLIGRPHFLTDVCHENIEAEGFHFREDNVLRDVTNYSNGFRGLSPLDELSQENSCTEYTEVISEQISCNSSMTAESNLSKQTNGSHSAKDSGICHTLESRLQDPLETEDRCSVEFEPNRPLSTSRAQSLQNHTAHSVAGEFIYVPPEEYDGKKPESESKSSSTSKNSAYTNVTIAALPLSCHGSEELSNLTNAIENCNLGECKSIINRFERTPLSSIDELDDDLNNITSPWVHIAHQECMEKMRQFQHATDVRSIHPALMPISRDKGDVPFSTSNTSDATDNTSSAYNTGESFKSSASENSRLNEKTNNVGADYNAKHKSQSRNHYITMAYSSDANSDGEGPACYLTHNEGSDSEGFEDARIEFRPVFKSKSSQDRPVPLPRILHPPQEATSFLAHSLTASTSNIWKATAAAARNRRQQLQMSNLKFNHTQKPPVKKHVNWKCSEDHLQNKQPSSENMTVENRNNLASKNSCLSSQPNQSSKTTVIPEVRRFSDHIRPNMKHPRVKRSASCTDGQGLLEDNKDVQMQWKVRVSRDGTRYITKRPVRDRLLREREKRLLAERCLTTDDDFTELKLGRHWSRDERKRHLRVARDKKRRRELMHQSRMGVLNDSTPANGEIVELSQKRMSKQKHKRMILDDFVTVQEILAHGDRSADIAKTNPFVSVTYI